MLQKFTCIAATHTEVSQFQGGEDVRLSKIVDESEYTVCLDPAGIVFIQDWFPDELAEVPRKGYCRIYDEYDHSAIVKMDTAKMLLLVNAAKKQNASFHQFN